jgi:hypothetical protein
MVYTAASAVLSFLFKGVSDYNYNKPRKICYKKDKCGTGSKPENGRACFFNPKEYFHYMLAKINNKIHIAKAITP